MALYHNDVVREYCIGSCTSKGGDGVVSYDVVREYCTGSCTSKGVNGVDIMWEDVVVSYESKDCTCDDVACNVMRGDGVIDGVLLRDIV